MTTIVTCSFLCRVPNVEQCVGNDGHVVHVVPDAGAAVRLLHLEPADGVFDEDDGGHRGVGVGLQDDDDDDVRLRAARIVVEPGVCHGDALVHHANEGALVQDQQAAWRGWQARRRRCPRLPAPAACRCTRAGVTPTNPDS